MNLANVLVKFMNKKKCTKRTMTLIKNNTTTSFVINQNIEKFVVFCGGMVRFCVEHNLMLANLGLIFKSFLNKL